MIVTPTFRRMLGHWETNAVAISEGMGIK
jgi:hypothetical protein